MACRGLCTEIWTRTPVNNVVACFQRCLWSIILLPVWACHSLIEEWSLFLHLPWVWASLWRHWPIEYAGRDSLPVLSRVLGGSWKPAATKVQLCWVSHAARSQVMWRRPPYGEMEVTWRHIKLSDIQSQPRSVSCWKQPNKWPQSVPQGTKESSSRALPKLLTHKMVSKVIWLF